MLEIEYRPRQLGKTQSFYEFLLSQGIRDDKFEIPKGDYRYNYLKALEGKSKPHKRRKGR